MHEQVACVDTVALHACIIMHISFIYQHIFYVCMSMNRSPAKSCHK